MPTAPRITTGTRISYSLGSFATGAFGTVPGLLLLPYLTKSLGVAAGIAGVLVLAPKLWDVIWNPIAGRISDRTVTPIGPRRPYLLWAGIAAGVLFALIFAGVLGTSAAAPVWVVAMFVLCATAYGFFQVTFSAIPAEITSDETERSRLLTWRVAILAVAILVTGGVSPVFVTLPGVDALTGYRYMGIFVAVFFLVGAFGTYFGLRNAPIGTITESEPTLRAQFAVAVKNVPFRTLLLCFVIQGAGIGTILAGVNYFADNVLHDLGAETFLFVAFVAPAILVMPLWRWIGRRIGTLRGFIVASLLFSLGGLALALFAWIALPVALSYVAVLFIGIGYAGEQVFALAMLADCIAYDTARTGKQQGGVLSGIWTAGETLGYALGPGIFGLFLQFSGFISTTAGQTVTQPDSVKWGVILGFGVAPAVLMALGLVLLRWYRLGREESGTPAAVVAQD